MTLSDRATRLAAALEADAGATPVGVEIDGGLAAVRAEVPGPRVNKAQSVASAYGFVLVGKEDGGAYVFESEAGLGDLGGLGLPGGVG